MAFKACLALAALARAVDALSDAPSPDNFVRRGTTAAAVLGNYVYVDGGEISQYENGKIGNPASVTVNSTLSIDMSKSWTAGTVTIRTIPKTGPRKTNVQVWADPDTNSFYSWGGKWIGGVNMTKTELWKFTADGSGGGAWSVQDPANPNVFGGLIPGEFSAYTTAKGSGFLIGGIASGWTEIYRAKTQTIPGMLTFNIKSKVWENGTFSAGFSPFDTLSGASAQYVPTFGPNGLILVFGGWSPRVDAEPDIKVSPVFDLQNITFFDPETKKKYSQVTTGDVPPSPRGRFCTVGFEREGGYDIFLFGGMNQRAQTNFDDAYILSLPGFVWTKMPQNPAGNRAEHSCVAVGNRQVLSIGGTDMSWTKNDPAKQGLLLFDMTAMKWSDSYDAGAAAYEAPDTIKSWYTKNSLDAVQWSSDDVKKLFATATQGSGSDTTTGSGSGSSGSTNESAGGTSSTSTGAIAGGVVGGVAGLALIGALVWFLLRRKKQRQAPSELHADATTGELGSPPPFSSDVKYTYAGGPQEIGGDVYRHEMYAQAKPPVGNNYHYELPANGRDQNAVELDSGELPRR